MMARRRATPATPGLFDLPAATTVMQQLDQQGAFLDLATEAAHLMQPHRYQSLARCLVADIADLERLLAEPLTSWQEKDQQVIEANTMLAFLVRSLADLLPADLCTLICTLTDLRARIVLRTSQEVPQ